MQALRPFLLVFGLLCCLYLLSAGGQGYSVDGTFSYEVARSLATDPSQAFIRRNRDTLRRWGPVAPALGSPFAWLGLQLGRWAPRPDTVSVDGTTLHLRQWPVIGAAGASSFAAAPTGGLPAELRIDLPAALPVHRVTLVSFLSFATALPDGAPVAEVILRDGATGAPSGRAVLRAGADTAEWSYDVPSTERPRHARARLAGHWPGNPIANLYASHVTLEPVETVASPGGQPSEQAPPPAQMLVRYVAPLGRLHVRAVAVSGPAGNHEPVGPATWSNEQQDAFFTRFGFSFANAPLMALTAALLVPLARLLGYSTRAGVLLAAGAGAGTLLWPYAKLDFSEPAAAAFALLATVLVYAARLRVASTTGRLAVLAGAGACAALAAGAKYTAAWFIPLLAIQMWLLWRWAAVDAPAASSSRGVSTYARLAAAGVWTYAPTVLPQARQGLAAITWQLAAFLVPTAVAAAVVVLLAGGVPTLWAGWWGGLSRGWLDFPLSAGLYGLLLSPGKSVFLYAPPIVLAALGAPAFVRRQRAGAFLFVAVPVVYLLVFAGKEVWHGGGWGPRYLVPAVPFAACLALPLVERMVSRSGRHLRVAGVALLAAGIGVQVLGVAKHPNLYAVLFRDHILPALPAYGAPLGGPAAERYWRHFAGPDADRQLDRPSAASDGDPPRGLGYLFAERGALELRLDPQRSGPFDLTLYVCDWDRRGRRQAIGLVDALGRREYAQLYDVSGCEYLTWGVEARAGQPVILSVDETSGADVPVVSAVFFDPAGALRQPTPLRDTTARGRWTGRYGAGGYILFAWRRGGADVAHLPPYVAGYGGGDRVWLDTKEIDLADTALLYAPAFSPLLAHAWLLGSDAVATLFPGNPALLQRALASPPWRYLAGLELHAPHPEYGLGLDFWPVLLYNQFRSHVGFMWLAWAVAAALLATGVACGWALLRTIGHSGSAPVSEVPVQ
ncbi:MAG: hypothetical protein HY332_02040 [Chloroflexi bacterium]|nr:hypothetical protein [Chloroflexota bacterium]